tara:strand:- start:189 stop:605 length:417 start_codon:yes stop_codon:yes gene_type:complete
LYPCPAHTAPPTNQDTTMNFLAYRTDSPVSNPVRVQFDIDGNRVKLDGSVFDGYTDLVVEIDTDPQGAAAGALVVLDEDTAKSLGFERKPRIVRAVARPVGDFADAKKGGMMDGHYVTASDSRWPFATPVPIHDRFEG